MNAHMNIDPIHTEPDTIPVIEGWVGNWRISLRRKNYSAEELCDLYDEKARDWEEDLSLLRVPEAYTSIHHIQTADTRNSPTTVKRVLDCGIGTGAFSTALVKSTPKSLEIHGVDISPEMLNLARERLASYGVQPHLTVADARRLPYGNNHFDLVMSAHMLEHLTNPKASLEEMVRVLKPGGRLLLCITRSSFLGRQIQLKWRTHAIGPKTAQRWMEDAGLTDVYFPRPNGHRAFNNRTLVCAARKLTA